LAFNKAAVTELNNNELLNVNGGSAVVAVVAIVVVANVYLAIHMLTN
jgi:lactobin A/cerein 7B family class IIb bacteriocin